MSRSRKSFALLLVITMAASTICGCTVNINHVPSGRGSEDEQTQETGVPELKSVDFDLTVYDENNEYKVFESHGNSYLLSEASAEIYPDLNTRLNKIDEDEKKYYTDTEKDNKEDAAEFAAEQHKDGEDYSYYCYSETELKAADERAVSFLRTEYGYLGGAHPDYLYEGFNIDTNTGEDILLGSIINDKDALKTLLIDKLNAQYPDGNFFDLEESLGEYELDPVAGDPETYAYTFTMDPAGLTFYFGPYDLNSYADGSQQIGVFYDEIADILKEDFVYSDYEKEGLGGDVPEEETADAEDVAETEDADEAEDQDEVAEAEESENAESEEAAEPTYQNQYSQIADELTASGQADNFALCDIDGDGVPELIAISSEGSWDKDQVFLYTFHDGEAVLLASDIAPGMEGHYIALYEGENLIELSGAAAGERHSYFELVEGELKPVLSLESYDDGDKTLYLVDGKAVSEEEYEEACDDFAAVHGTKIILDLEDKDSGITYMSIDELNRCLTP